MIAPEKRVLIGRELCDLMQQTTLPVPSSLDATETLGTAEEEITAEKLRVEVMVQEEHIRQLEAQLGSVSAASRDSSRPSSRTSLPPRADSRCFSRSNSRFGVGGHPNIPRASSSRIGCRSGRTSPESDATTSSHFLPPRPGEGGRRRSYSRSSALLNLDGLKNDAL